MAESDYRDRVKEVRQEAQSFLRNLREERERKAQTLRDSLQQGRSALTEQRLELAAAANSLASHDAPQASAEPPKPAAPVVQTLTSGTVMTLPDSAPDEPFSEAPDDIMSDASDEAALPAPAEAVEPMPASTALADETSPSPEAPTAPSSSSASSPGLFASDFPEGFRPDGVAEDISEPEPEPEAELGPELEPEPEIDVAAAEPAPEPEEAPAPDATTAAEAAAQISASADISALKGVGGGMVWRLHQLGVSSIGELSQQDADTLKARLGGVGNLVPVQAWIDQANAVVASR